MRPDPGAVLAKAARRTGRWLELTPEEFEAASGLPMKGTAAPVPNSLAWTRCLALVEVAGRLEATLGRRSAVREWLQGAHLALMPTPRDVLTSAAGPAALKEYLDAFER